MKKYILYFACLLYFLPAGAQTCITDEDPEEDPSSCCNELISTDFNYPYNTEYPALLNLFDWLAPTEDLPNPQTLDVNIGNSLVHAEHPLLLDHTNYYWFSEYRNGQGFPQDMHNMHPRFGWELLHKNLGLGLHDEGVDSNSGQSNPYMLFYNKHTGKLRMFVSPGEGNSFDNANVDLVIADGGAGSPLVSSAILNRYEAQQKALDQDGHITKISSHLPFTTPNKWTVADFQLAYDPCNCSRESRVNFNFTERNFAQADLYGRIVGRNVPLSNGGESPLAFGDDFLSSVWVDADNDGVNDNGKNSMLVYNQIENDVESAYVSDAMKLLSTALSIAGSSIKGIKINIPIPGPQGASLDTLKKVPVGAMAAAGVGFATKQLNPSAPNITYLEAEAVIEGNINDVSNSGGLANLELLSPGSYTPIHEQVPWTQHTFYNELPGLFALLKTPNMQFAHEWDGDGGFGVAIEDPLEYALNPSAEIDMEATEIYAAIEFDVYSPLAVPLHVYAPELYGDSYDGSSFDQIIAGLVGLPEGSPHDSYTNPDGYDGTQSMAKILRPSFNLAFVEFFESEDLTNMYPVLEDLSGNMNTTHNPAYTTPGLKTRSTFQTAFVPIDKIDGLRFTEKFKLMVMNHSHWSNVYPELLDLFNFRLKIVANYKFLPNEYGEANESIQIYTHEFGTKNEISFAAMDACTDGTNPICDTETYNQYEIHEDLTLHTTHYTQSADIYAENIFIIGELTTDPGVVINLYASQQIRILDLTDQDPNLDHPSVAASINLIIRDIYPHEGLNPVPENELKSFCASSTYQAETRQADFSEDEEFTERKNNLVYNLYPNPASDQLNFYLELEKDSDVKTRLMNINGTELGVLSINETWSAGEYSKRIQTTNLPTGLYLFEICVDGNCSVEKVSIFK